VDMIALRRLNALRSPLGMETQKLNPQSVTGA
jgi:hypothetical protein